MANGPALSTAKGGEIYLGSEFKHSLSHLDVLDANQFNEQSFDRNERKLTEENFYRGAPPKWLNFHMSEQAVSDGTGTPFIKRDGYDTLVKQIHQMRKLPRTSTVKLLHQPGCGGTTLAMQVLWDLRKTFRCSVLTDSTGSDVTNVAEQVVQLFTAGIRGHQNTVLLLVNNEQILENLQEQIMMKIEEREIVTYMPVVILLSCVREDVVQQGDHVTLKNVLSDKEKRTFDEKKKELISRYGDRHNQFHGFNIMQTNFSQAYVKQACTVLGTIQKQNRKQKSQLAAFLSLLNAYAPGSYLLESQCLDFFKHDDYIQGDASLWERMKPFSDLIITFQQERSEKMVRMAHPLIAQHCTKLMVEAGVTRSDTARNFLTCFCSEEVPKCLFVFIKDMLTKRRTKTNATKKREDHPNHGTEIREDQEKFSRLILDIQNAEGNKQSASVLKVASNKFDEDPFFPQALARFYYIEQGNYNLAEMWAKEAMARDPQNSFVADTLGQVYKNHLQNKGVPENNALPAKPREILQLATKAIEAFKEEERLAEKEQETNMKEDGNTKVSYYFNSSGLFGYLKVCILVYDILVSQNETWRQVLTKQISIGSVLESLGDNKLHRFHDLINNLADEVKRKCVFYDKYLTFSKPGMMKDDPLYLSKDCSECYTKYVRDSTPKPLKQKVAFIEKLKQNLADTVAGVLPCLEEVETESELKKITTWWEEICERSSCKSLSAFRHKIPLSPDAPELHLLALLYFWPVVSEEDKCVFNLNKLIQLMKGSYEHTYEKYFRSRYLRTLFFIGKSQDLTKIVHREILETKFEQKMKTKEDWNNNWSKEKIFQDPMFKDHLLKVEGVVRNYRVFATIDGTLIEVDANLRKHLWRARQVSFYLGFTIRGPVAFGIKTKTAENAEVSEQINTELLAPTDTSGDGTRPDEGHS